MHDIKKSAFVVVDPERGFSSLCPDELPVPGALEIVPLLNELLVLPWYYKYATQDWHPENHCSFKEQGGPYNKHCVQNTEGARFLPGLRQEQFNAIFRKGYKQNKDAPSPFADHLYLKVLFHGLDIYLTGICTNICVWETALDCAKYLIASRVVIIEDACAALDLPDDHMYNLNTTKAKAAKMGIEYIQSKELLGAKP